MRILFTSEHYFPNVSGVPVVVRYLAEGLFKLGNDVAIATQCVKGSPDVENMNGVKIHRFNIWRDWKHTNKGDFNSYINFIKKYTADVLIIECAECLTTDILLPYLSELKCKKVFHAHGLSGFDNKFFEIKENFKHTIGSTYNWFNSKIYFEGLFKKSIQHIDMFLCLSEVDSGIEYVKKNAKKYQILDNAADNMFYSPNISDDLISKYVKLSNSRYLISCANYTVVKNQKKLIREYYKSRSSHTYSLVCIGSSATNYFYECINLVKKLEQKYGHRDVHLLYGVQRTDIPSIFKGASLYLVSSIWEQYSISLIEAMSQGVPFISTNVGNASVLPGGITLLKKDCMHKKIDFLLTDKVLYKTYSSAGKEYAYSNCRIDIVVRKLVSIINEL